MLKLGGDESPLQCTYPEKKRQGFYEGLLAEEVARAETEPFSKGPSSLKERKKQDDDVLL